MGTIKFSWPVAVVQLVIFSAQLFPPLRVFTNPVPESPLDFFLPILRDGGFLGVDHPDIVAVLVRFGVVNPHGLFGSAFA